MNKITLDMVYKEKLYQLSKAVQNKRDEINKLSKIEYQAQETLHDLSTPLTSIILNFEYLNKFLNKPPKSIKETLELIKINISQIETILEQYHDDSNINLNKTIETCITAFNDTFKKEEINFKFNKLVKNVKYKIPQKTFIKIINNLIQNSIDALISSESKNKKIEITLSKIDNVINLEFYDNGVGISEENLNRVFFPMYTTKKTSKNGFGLYNIKNKIEALGGNIFVESKPKKYTKFIITLPANW